MEQNNFKYFFLSIFRGTHISDKGLNNFLLFGESKSTLMNLDVNLELVIFVFYKNNYLEKSIKFFYKQKKYHEVKLKFLMIAFKI